MGRKRSNDDGIMGCLVYVLIAIFFMPIVGLFMLWGKDPEKKSLGLVLLITGILLWIILALCSA